MRVAVFGAGGVGGYFGGRLAEAGHDVTFVARGDHLTALRETGLRVESIAGDFVISPASATDFPADVGPVELVIVGTKTWQLPAAAAAMSSLVGPDTAALPLLNGVEAPRILDEHLGAGHALGGLCRLIAFRAGPGLIRHTGVDPIIVFGELDGTESARARAILDAFDRASGVEIQLSPDVTADMWKKLLLIASVSAVGAATGATFGVIRSLPETRDLLAACVNEACEVGRALGVNLPDDQLEVTLRFVDGLPPDATTSMQRDIAAGLPSELEAQLGAVVRLARDEGVATPTSATLYASLLPHEMRARAGREPAP